MAKCLDEPTAGEREGFERGGEVILKHAMIVKGIDLDQGAPERLGEGTDKLDRVGAGHVAVLDSLV